MEPTSEGPIPEQPAVDASPALIAPAPPRPSSVTVAGVFLIVLGVLIGLFGLLFALVGVAFPAMRESPDLVEQLGPLPESFGTFILALGLVLLAWGVVGVLAGVYVMQRRTWARIAGIVVGVLGALAGLASSLPPATGANVAVIIISLLFLGAHVYVIWVLVRAGAWFSRP
jgi:hypothetical protein